MRVAMVAGGQQRFNSFFVENINLLKDVSEINLYMYMWKQGCRSESEFILPDGLVNAEYIKSASNIINRVNITVVDEPNDDIIPESVRDVPGNSLADSEHTARVFKQFCSLYNAFALHESEIMEHDCIIRFRPDCKLDRELNLKSLDLQDGIYTPNNTKVSLSPNYPPICDQFAIGNTSNMKVYLELGKHIPDYMLRDLRGNIFNTETLMSCHLTEYNIKVNYGDFFHDIKNRPLNR